MRARPHLQMFRPALANALRVAARECQFGNWQDDVISVASRRHTFVIGWCSCSQGSSVDRQSQVARCFVTVEPNISLRHDAQACRRLRFLRENLLDRKDAARILKSSARHQSPRQLEELGISAVLGAGGSSDPSAASDTPPPSRSSMHPHVEVVGRPSVYDLVVFCGFSQVGLFDMRACASKRDRTGRSRREYGSPSKGDRRTRRSSDACQLS